jgi:hypothetical protein
MTLKLQDDGGGTQPPPGGRQTRSGDFQSLTPKAWRLGSPPPLRAFLATLLLACAASAQAQETVLYRQVFGKEGEGNADIASVNWEHFTSGEGHAWVVGGIPGQPQNLANINTSQPAKIQETGVLNCSVEPDGYYFARPSAAERIAFIKADLDPAHYKSLVFRWYSGANTDQQTQRLAIQIGSRWFAAENVIQNPIGWEPFADKALQAAVEFSPDGANWRELLTEPGNKFRLADETLSGQLPAGPIKNFGVFCQNPGGAPQTSSVVDTFEVAGTPVK